MSLMNAQTTITSQQVLDRLAVRLPQLRHLIRPDQPIGALGLDSIDFVEMLCVIESELNVTVRDDDLAAAATVGELAELICRRRREREI